jgi:hypothetical protein
MFPFVFEWQGEAGHYIFLGLFYLVLIIIGIGIGAVIVKTALQMMGFARERHFH